MFKCSLSSKTYPLSFFFTSVHLICACELKPKPTVFPLKRLAILAHHGLSALYTNTPPSLRFSNISAFACATPSILLSPSRCVLEMLIIAATSGAPISDSRRISPGAFVPISSTPYLCLFSISNIVTGTPMKLLKLFCDFAVGPNRDNK